MKIKNYEFKARCNDIIAMEKRLLTLSPRFLGEDHQIDTYFNVPNGLLKLREGKLENALIYYERPLMRPGNLELKNYKNSVHIMQNFSKCKKRITFHIPIVIY